MTERHPLKPFLPTGAKILMLGSFPPPMKRWKMPFYYPNFQNDMWRIFGIVFFNDLNHFIDVEKKCFKQDEIIDFLTTNGIAIYDSAVEIERGNNDASDANLQVIERINLSEILAQIPDCKAIVSTGGKSAEIVADILGVKTPAVGEFVETIFSGRPIRLYRMPSTSRAFPLKIEVKARAYEAVREIVE
ncbi:MAG: uracil-DNA glycosylase family protein [Bacteroidales bacterium]|nr:uracil-DNA glycosylase family protein [Bacteroidales bacterium]